jgi:hypothetical protein
MQPKIKISLIFFLCFFSQILFADQTILVKSKISKAPCLSEPNLFGANDQLEFNYTLTSYNNADEYLRIQLDHPSLHSLILRIPYMGKPAKKNPDTPDESAFLLTGSLEKIPQGQNYLAFVYDDLYVKRSFLLGLYSFSTTVPHLVYMNFKNEVIYYEPYLGALIKVQKKDPKQFNLIFYFKEKNNGTLPYQKELQFFDLNNDNKVDLIKATESYSSFITTSKNFYQGPEYLTFISRKYKKLLQKARNIFIAKNEIGIFSFEGEKEKIQITPLKNEHLSFLFQMGHELMKSYDNLDTTYLSEFDKDLREFLKIEITSIQ